MVVGEFGVFSYFVYILGFGFISFIIKFSLYSGFGFIGGGIGRFGCGCGGFGSRGKGGN